MSRDKILIVDDHAAFGESFAAVLSERQIGQAKAVTSVPAALAYLAKETPHIAIIDISLSHKYEGLEFIRQLKSKWPQVKPICLTRHNNNLVCEQAYDAGVWAYFTKTAPLEETLEGIQQVQQATAPSTQPKLKATKYHFTPRECEILAYLATGASNKEIARSLEMAEETAKVHMKALLRKLDFKNRTQVAIFAYENGYWPDDLA